MNAADLQQLADRLLETATPAGNPIGGVESAHLIGRLEGKGDTLAMAILTGKPPEELQRIAQDWIELRLGKVVA